MPYATESTYEYLVFRGTLATAKPLGIKQVRTQERDEPAEAFSAAVDSWVGPKNETLSAGAVMRREVRETARGVLGEPGPWEFWGYIWEPRVQSLRPVLMGRVNAADPGQPMRNPLGWPIILPDGTQPVQPTPQEPQRDPWTGQVI